MNAKKGGIGVEHPLEKNIFKLDQDSHTTPIPIYPLFPFSPDTYTFNHLRTYALKNELPVR